jgi:hypothetical protein
MIRPWVLVIGGLACALIGAALGPMVEAAFRAFG